MATSSNPTVSNAGKLTDIPLNPGKIQQPAAGHGPGTITFLATCNTQFTLAASKAGSANAQLTIVPHEDSKFFTTSVKETAVVFKPSDASLKGLAAKWNTVPPGGTLAYTTFPNAILFGSDLEGLLFVLNGDTHQLVLRDSSGTHVWQSAPKTVYCRKSKLFLLHGEGYSMMVDFGL